MKYKADTINGNGKLAYLIGLITADELAIGGNVWGEDGNKTSYLFKGDMYWTLSPNSVNATGQARDIFLKSGYISGVWSSNSAGVASVINLSTEAVSHFTGDGTLNNPFTISP